MVDISLQIVAIRKLGHVPGRIQQAPIENENECLTSQTKFIANKCHFPKRKK